MTSPKTSNPPDPAPPGVEFYSVGFGVYEHFPQLEVDPEIARVARQFEAFGARDRGAWAAPMADRNWPAVKQRLEDWVGSGATGSILYWVGHGVSNKRFSGLAFASSPSNPREVQELVTPDTFARYIGERDADEADTDHWTLVLIDACQADEFIQQVDAALNIDAGPRRVLMLASNAPGSVAILGGLSKAVEGAIASFISVPDVDLVRLAREIKLRLQTDGVWAVKQVEDVILHNTRALPPGLRGTLDDARALVAVIEALPPGVRASLRSRLDALQLGEAVWHFTGRATELETIGAWLATPGPMLVVTGGAGSGKSALLGQVLLRADPVVWAAIRDELAGESGPDLTAGPRITAAVRLTGADVPGLVAALALRLHLGVPVGNTAEAMTTWLITALAGSERPIVLADGLDEAADVVGVASLLGRLVDGGHARVVVGTRRSIRSEWGPAEPAEADLVDRLLSSPGSERLTVERDPTALAAYARSRLSAAASAGVVGVQRRLDRMVAELADAPDFLFVRLAVLELIGRPALADSGWLGQIKDNGPAAIFRQTLLRLDDLNPRFRSLLLALAQRQGRGMPAELNVWLAAAQGSADAGRVPEPADLDELLAEAGAPYIVADNQYDTTAYRLAHRIFETTLLGDEPR